LHFRDLGKLKESPVKS